MTKTITSVTQLRQKGIELAKGPADDIHPAVVQLTRLLDEAFTIPGTSRRVGLDGLIGLVPGVGDLVTTIFSLVLLYEAKRLGISKTTRLKMAGHAALDALVGAIPLVGDVFDLTYKANSRNLRLIQRELEKARRNR